MEKSPITYLESTVVDSGSYRINANGENIFIRHGVAGNAKMAFKIMNISELGANLKDSFFFSS